MSDSSPAISVLDLVPVRSDQSTSDALAATRRLARVADELGFRRYWLAEHHNMPAVAATNPPVLVAMVAAVTERIRVGSGGVMLPNHAPLVVAEQFALLEAAYPGRIDLGIGRAPGTDPVTAWALRHGGGGVEDDAVARFPRVCRQHHGDALARRRRAAPVHGPYAPRATPHATSVPGVWLLGSSDYSARLAAEKGCPTSSRTTSPAGARPRRSRSTATTSGHRPTTPSRDVPDRQRRRGRHAAGGRPARPAQPAVDGRATHRAAAAGTTARGGGRGERPPPAARGDLAQQMLDRWVVGTPESASAQVRELATSFGVDEVMVNPVAGALRGTPTDSSPAREQTLRLLAAALS